MCCPRRCGFVRVYTVHPKASFGEKNKSVAQVPQGRSTSIQLGSQPHNGGSLFFGDVKSSGHRRDSVRDIVEGGAANPAANAMLKENPLVADA